MKFKNTLVDYFNFFSDKDLDSLASVFAEDIILKDWSIHVSGKKNVLEALNEVFVLNNSIKVAPISFYSNSDYSYAVQLSLLVNDSTTLNVIDVVNLDMDGKISEVVAFKYGHFV